jgi:two-component system, OmpR family, KDP operon response regulator KdpE
MSFRPYPLPSSMAEVLVVAADPDARAQLRELLESWRFALAEAATAALAILAVRGRALDLVLVDLELPDHAGSKLIARLRTFAPCPIIVLSACADEEEKIAALNTGGGRLSD